jgi:hypothetical protein
MRAVPARRACPTRGSPSRFAAGASAVRPAGCQCRARPARRGSAAACGRTAGRRTAASRAGGRARQRRARGRTALRRAIGRWHVRRTAVHHRPGGRSAAWKPAASPAPPWSSAARATRSGHVASARSTGRPNARSTRPRPLRSGVAHQGGRHHHGHHGAVRCGAIDLDAPVVPIPAGLRPAAQGATGHGRAPAHAPRRAAGRCRPLAIAYTPAPRPSRRARRAAASARPAPRTSTPTSAPTCSAFIAEAVSGSRSTRSCRSGVRPARHDRYRLPPCGWRRQPHRAHRSRPPRGYPLRGEVHDENAYRLGGVAGTPASSAPRPTCRSSPRCCCRAASTATAGDRRQHGAALYQAYRRPSRTRLGHLRRRGRLRPVPHHAPTGTPATPARRSGSIPITIRCS